MNRVVLIAAVSVMLAPAPASAAVLDLFDTSQSRASINAYVAAQSPEAYRAAELRRIRDERQRSMVMTALAVAAILAAAFLWKTRQRIARSAYAGFTSAAAAVARTSQKIARDIIRKV